MAFGLQLPNGRWLQSFDPDAHAPGVPYPTGDALFTEDGNKALRFKDYSDAVAFLFTQSKVTPLRPDGGRNLPLRAFTMAVAPLPDA